MLLRSARLSSLLLLTLSLGACTGEQKDEGGGDEGSGDEGAADGSEGAADGGAADGGAADGAVDGGDGAADGGADDGGADSGEPAWSYAGETGPEFWGELDEEWAACGEGTAQSPINIERGDLVPGEGAPPALSWGPTALNAYNSGHYVRYNVDLGSTIEFGGRVYGLEQLHFHGLSEHTVEGAHFDMEVHFVHADLADPTALLVVAAFGEVADDPATAMDIFGPEGALRFYDALGLAESESPTTLEGEVDLGVVFDGLFAGGVLTYGGSLTTPPCTEGVQFVVASAILALPLADMEAFLGVYDFNYRPVQPLHGREIRFFAPAPG